MPMKVVVAGGSGFLGSALVTHLASAGHDVVVLTRRPARGTSASRVREVAWQPESSSPGAAPGPWARELDGADAVVNLAGAGLADRRWTAARKALLRSSRLLSTRSLVAAMHAASPRPAVFVQGSAVGYYGTTADRTIDETSPPGTDFLATLCVDWEAESAPAESPGCRLVIVRTGVVLGPGGGALRPLRRLFALFLGGPIASGRQYMSWIHLADWVALVAWALENPSVAGVVNATAPHPVTNAEFSRALGRALHRPSWLPVPAFALRLAVGEVADVALITGQQVLPRKTMALGFSFRYPTVDEAMAAAVR
jgi:uncharacterized protein